MQYNTHDIILRRERNGDKVLWLFQGWVMDNVKVTELYLRAKARRPYNQSVPKYRRKQTIMPNTGKSWRYGKFNNKFYYAYANLPQNRKDQIPSKEEIIKAYNNSQTETRLAELTTKVRAALDDYGRFVTHYAELTDLHCKRLAKACAVVTFAAAQLYATNYDVKKYGFFEDLSIVVQRLDIKYLPKSSRRLKNKVIGVYNGQPVAEVITLPRAGNSAARIEDRELMSWMIQMRSMPQNYTNEHIIRKLMQMCELRNMNLAPESQHRIPKRTWFAEKFAQHNTKWMTARGRFGTKGRRTQLYTGYMPVQNAIYAGDCWQIDGTRVNFIGHFDKNTGKERFLYIIAIRDVHSGDILGWHFDYKEDRWGYVAALKMAVGMTGYLPYEIVVDRFPGHNTQEWGAVKGRLEREGCKVTVTSKATGKAAVERFFGTLQTVHFQESEWYYGEGVQSRRDSAHRSAEYIKKMKKKARQVGWDFDMSYKEAVRCIEAYRNMKLSDYSRKNWNVEKSPKQLHDESEKPHTFKIEPWTFAELFGLEKQVSIRKAGKIVTDIQRVQYVYDVEMYSTIAQYTKVKMCYDIEDLSKVYLFQPTDDINRKYLGEAHETRAVQIYGPDADSRDVGKQSKRIREIEEQRQAEAEAIINGGSEVDLLLAGMCPKTDSSSAETAWLEERAGSWKDEGKVRILSTEAPVIEDEDDDIEIDPSLVRNQY